MGAERLMRNISNVTALALHDLHGELCISVLVTENSKGNVLSNILASVRWQIRHRISRT